MNVLGTNIFPKKSQPTLGLPPPGADSAEGTPNFKKGRQAAPPPPPLGEGIQATKKRLDRNPHTSKESDKLLLVSLQGLKNLLHKKRGFYKG